MILDAFLAYLHFTAIFMLFAFLAVQAILIKGPLDARTIRLVGRTDLWYFGAAIGALLTGLLRVGFGAKGADFYFQSWPVYVKIALFVVVGVTSVFPTQAYVRWRRTLDHDPAWVPPAEEQKRVRKLVMTELHLAALIPVFAVIMSRGLWR